ncbi:MAG: FkbM family methyltransferase [Oscillatoriales cyanobacterium SM2_2_1]|nr:FkbM family methyltransferase [Oscillatoriales cyanobacterium SM2_2_1]
MSLFVSQLLEQGLLENLNFTVGIVGSRKLLNYEELDDGWRLLGDRLTIIGFDADPDACDAANREMSQRQEPWHEQHLPYVLGASQEERTLYVAKELACTSLLPPNEGYLQRFEQLHDAMALDFEIPVQTATLDQVWLHEKLPTLDFLITDVQGADLEILQGAEKILDQALLVQSEVLFAPLYIGQAYFSDTEQWLRSRRFNFHSLTAFGRPRRRFTADVSPSNRVSKEQILWGDALFCRDLWDTNGDFSDMQTHEHQVLKLACMMDLLGFSDYAYDALQTCAYSLEFTLI